MRSATGLPTEWTCSVADQQHLLPHARHDRELIARASADELTGSDRTRAEDLMASCRECAALIADLRAIADSTKSLGASFDGPIEPAARDFRLTSEDATRLGRRSTLGLARMGVSGSWTRRMGGALATLGLVGLLVSAVPLGFFGSASAPSDSAGAAADPAGAALGATPEAATQADSAQDLTASPPGPQEFAPPLLDLSIKASAGPERAGVPGQKTENVRSGSAPLAITAAGILVAGLVLLLVSRNGRRPVP